MSQKFAIAICVTSARGVARFSSAAPRFSSAAARHHGLVIGCGSNVVDVFFRVRAIAGPGELTHARMNCYCTIIFCIFIMCV